MLGPKEILQLFNKARELSKKHIMLHPENRDRTFTESKLAIDYNDRLQLQKWLLQIGIEIESAQLLFRASKDGFTAK